MLQHYAALRDKAVRYRTRRGSRKVPLSAISVYCVDCMGFNPIGVRAAIEMCGVNRVVFGSDFGPVPYGIKEHVQIVEDVVPSLAERQLVFWKKSNRIFRLGLSDTDLITSGEKLIPPVPAPARFLRASPFRIRRKRITVVHAVSRRPGAQEIHEPVNEECANEQKKRKGAEIEYRIHES
jgi:hypothetical protein